MEDLLAETRQRRGATSSAQGILPAPSWARAGDFVFVSSIYPVDRARLVSSDPAFAWDADSAMEAQTRAVLESLEVTLGDAGTSLDNVLKTEVYLADAADFPDFKRVYARFFPEKLPARTTIIVADEHIVPGARLNLQAVALAGDSNLERVEISTASEVPDPTEAEHTSLAVRAGPFVFCSGLPATDFKSGLAVGKARGFPHFGSDAQMQATYLLDNLAAVLEAAGSSLDQGLKVQFYETDLLNFYLVDRTWGERVGVPPTRSSMGCRDFLVPGALWVPNLLALVPGQGLEKRETRAGIRWHPVEAGKANFSPGIVAGDWLFTAGQIPVPDISKPEWVGTPAGLPNYWDDIQLQAEFTMQLLSEQLDANGFGLADVVDARVYLVEPRRDFRGFARVWERLFRDVESKPAMSVIPSKQADGRSGVMVPGPTIEIDLISKRSA
jgi:enamine deaminase RidA (YjgF/YER057c/UK114 family)